MEAFANSDHKFPSFPFPNVGPRHVDAASNRKSATNEERGTYSHPQCLKITQKVAFNIASEASYVSILSGQQFIQNAKNGHFWPDFENLKLPVKQYYQIGHF